MFLCCVSEFAVHSYWFSGNAHKWQQGFLGSLAATYELFIETGKFETEHFHFEMLPHTSALQKKLLSLGAHLMPSCLNCIIFLNSVRHNYLTVIISSLNCSVFETQLIGGTTSSPEGNLKGAFSKCEIHCLGRLRRDSLLERLSRP